MRLTFILFCFFLFSSGRLVAQSFDYKEMEAINAKAIAKAYAASVRMWGYDTVSQKKTSSQFSGVVVSKEGHILTAAHAVETGSTYRIFFPDGQEYLAVALGRIAIPGRGNLPDVAMAKIVGSGSWPVAEMGWSYSLKVNQPVISISYPETLNQPRPTVRFGRILSPVRRDVVTSTCKMEPGDSGGPLVDQMGRVVAIHSRIGDSEEENLEISVDLYREFWSALEKRIDYRREPVSRDVYTADSLVSQILVSPQLETLDQQFSDSETMFNGTYVSVLSTAGPTDQIGVGTVLSLGKLRGFKQLRKNGLVVSKSSLVGDDPFLQTNTGEKLRASVLARDDENDLVLLKVDKKLESGVSLQALKDELSFHFADLGRFLLSPLPSKGHKVGVLANESFSLPRKFSVGYFGANARFIDNEIVLTDLDPRGPAAVQLKAKDKIKGINGVSISRPEDYGAELMKYGPGDTIRIQGMREGVPFDLEAHLVVDPWVDNHPADIVKGGKSLRRDGFDRVFSHDASITANECGGPVFTPEGRFCGINIARFSRTSTLVMPSSVLYRFVMDNLKR